MRDRIVLLMKLALVVAMFAVVAGARPLFD